MIRLLKMLPTRIDELPPGTVTFLEEEDVARRNFDQQKALKGAKVSFDSKIPPTPILRI